MARARVEIIVRSMLRLGDRRSRWPKASGLSTFEQAVLSAVKHLIDHGATCPLTIERDGVTRHVNAVSRDDVRKRASANGLANDGAKPNTIQQRFGRAITSLCRRQIIDADDSLVWLV